MGYLNNEGKALGVLNQSHEVEEIEFGEWLYIITREIEEMGTPL